MNGNLPRQSADEGLDPDLAEMFDHARQPLAEDVFVSSVMLRIHRARRLRLVGQASSLVAILVLGAFLAPYVARETLSVVGWLGDGLPATGMMLTSPVGYVCAALLAWRITRWARSS